MAVITHTLGTACTTYETLHSQRSYQNCKPDYCNITCSDAQTHTPLQEDCTNGEQGLEGTGGAENKSKYQTRSPGRQPVDQTSGSECSSINSLNYCDLTDTPQFILYLSSLMAKMHAHKVLVCTKPQLYCHYKCM